MTMTSYFDFIRVSGALALLFVALPVAARRMSDRAVHPWYRDALPSFIYASLFYEIAATILGNWRLCYGGFMAVLIVCWLAATIAFASRRRWIWNASSWRSGFLSVLKWFEHRPWRTFFESDPAPRTVFVTRTVLLFGALLSILLANRLGFALGNVRFLGAQTYDRALSLQTLIHGAAWVRDGSVALLAPVAHFSGADGATVIRFSGPLFSVLLAVAGGYCAWVYVSRWGAAFFAALLLAIYPAILGFDSPGEMAGPELASLYWLLALASLRSSWRCAAASAVMAFMIHSEFTPVLAGTLLCVSTAVLFSVASRIAPRFLTVPAGVAGVLLCALVLRPMGLAAPDGPYQYESAARAADSIARSFPRNRWMIVSPAHELPATYGRGWHLPISDFVRSHTPEEAARPDFQFPYTVDEVFVFVEKEPLRQSARGAGMAGDEYSYRYLTQIGRTALQFEAARLMAAYASGHRNASVYADDERLMVYRITLDSPSN